VRWPGRETRVETHPTSHMDVVPTLMRDYFHCQNPAADYSHGRSWSKSAILEGKTVMVLESYGIERRNVDDYSLEADQKPNLRALQAVMRSRSQFLATERVAAAE
jgi:membrane-anchored protein YejM (alkaline phosphatase superfamily)